MKLTRWRRILKLTRTGSAHRGVNKSGIIEWLKRQLVCYLVLRFKGRFFTGGMLMFSFV